MASATRQSIAKAKEQLTPLLAKADIKFAEELFALGTVMASSAQLRGILSDPSAESGAKAGIVKSVFGKSASSVSLGFLTGLVDLRWSQPRDLVEALEQLAVYAIAGIATKAKKLEEVQSVLFAFQQAITSDSELQFALADKNAPSKAKAELVKKLIGKQAPAEATLLVVAAVNASGKRRASVVLAGFAKQLADYAERLVATVTVATPLSAASIKRLEQTLSAKYGRPMTLNVELNPSIIGGVRVQVAGEVIDGSIATRLKAAKLQLA